MQYRIKVEYRSIESDARNSDYLLDGRAFDELHARLILEVLRRHAAYATTHRRSPHDASVDLQESYFMSGGPEPHNVVIDVRLDQPTRIEAYWTDASRYTDAVVRAEPCDDWSVVRYE